MPVFHEFYPYDLSAAPDEIKRHEFAKMLGTPEIVLVGVLGAGLPDLHDAVCRFNDAQARAVAGTQADTWLRLKVVVWRGSWCVRASFQRNKRRKLRGPPGPDLLGTLPVQLGPDMVTLHPLSMSIRAMSWPSLTARARLGSIGIAGFAGIAAAMLPVAPGAAYNAMRESQRAAEQETERRIGVAMGLEKAPGQFVLGRPDYSLRFPPLDRPKAHPFGENHAPHRGGKAARKMQRRARR